MNRIVWLVAAALTVPTLGSAQSSSSGRSGERILLDTDEEIALARSAAPSGVSAEATVLVFNGAGFSLGVEGTNGVTCYVARTWPKSLEPHCFDEEGSVTILPIHLRKNELMIAGATEDEIDAAVGKGIASGEFRLPSRPVFSYMMSAAQVLYSDSGDFVGAWEPHVMIYFPYLTQEDVGGASALAGAIVSDGGSPLSNVIFVVPTAVPSTHSKRGTR